jgi:hypothetical protein
MTIALKFYRYVVMRLFEALQTDPERLLNPSAARSYRDASDDRTRHRVICDYVAGMMDSYATRIYERFLSRVRAVYLSAFRSEADLLYSFSQSGSRARRIANPTGLVQSWPDEGCKRDVQEMCRE